MSDENEVKTDRAVVAEASTTESKTAESSQGLIERLDQAKKKARTARISVTIALVLAAGVNVAVILFGGKSFLENEVDDVLIATSANMGVVVDRHSPQFRKAVGRVVPHYMRKIDAMMRRESPDMKRRLAETAASLDEYALKKWPEVDAAANDVLKTQSASLVKAFELALERELTDQEYERVVVNYTESATKLAASTWHEFFEDHEQAVSELETSLDLLVRTEPDLNREIKLQETIGILLEFIGVELQLEQEV